MKRPGPFVLTLIIVTLLAALPRVTASIYTPAMPMLALDFNTTSDAVKLTFTSYILGLAVGHLFYGPLSDSFGRRPVLLVGLGAFAVTSAACALAPSVEAMTIGRFLQAGAASSGGVLARAIVRDLFGPDRTAQALAYVAMATTLSPALGPLIGGQIQHYVSWEAIFLVLAVLGLVMFATVLRFLPETRPSYATRLTSWRDIRRAFGVLLRSPTFMGYSLNSAFILSALLCFFGSAPFILIDSLGLSARDYGFYTGIGVIGYIAGNFVATRLPGHKDIERFVRMGSIVAAIGCLLMLVLALFWPPNIWAVIGPFAVASMGAGIALPAGFAGSINRYPEIAGTSSSLAGFLNMAAATVATSLMTLLSTRNALALAALMTIMTLLALGTGIFLRLKERPETTTA